MTIPDRSFDAVIIGSGPNGLAAAITIAQAGRSVLMIEAQDTIGGGSRTAELTLPGFHHDVGSSVHPMAISSPFFRTLPLAQHGLQWVHPGVPLAHPLDDGTAAVLHRSAATTAIGLGVDGANYANLMEPIVATWSKIQPLALASQRIPRHPIADAQFGIHALRAASSLARSTFSTAPARALFAGLAAHSMLPLEQVPSAAFGLVLGAVAHTAGWPFARGGSQHITNALAAYLRSLGGEIVTGTPVHSLADLPPASAVLCDVTPRQLLAIAGSHFSSAFRNNLARFRYGPGVCKLDWALDAPVPWRAEACTQAGTIHLGATIEEIEASERDPWHGKTSPHPFVLFAQPTLFDPTRAPAGKHIAWAYCHVPNDSPADMTEAIESQIERFAPGFRQRILKRSVMIARDLHLHNANLIGGDIGGGATTLSQLFLRPTWRRYGTAAKGIYICSSSTPPGGGVHGMCGHLAARQALRECF